MGLDDPIKANMGRPLIKPTPSARAWQFADPPWEKKERVFCSRVCCEDGLGGDREGAGDQEGSGGNPVSCSFRRFISV